MNSFHWLRAFLILLATCVAVVAFTTRAAAEEMHHGAHHKHDMPAYADIDANADGSVTAEEFTAFHNARMAERAKAGHKLKHAKNAPAFADLDLDDDGNLSAEEFATHQAECPMHKKMGAAEDKE